MRQGRPHASPLEECSKGEISVGERELVVEKMLFQTPKNVMHDTSHRQNKQLPESSRPETRPCLMLLLCKGTSALITLPESLLLFGSSNFALRCTTERLYARGSAVSGSWTLASAPRFLLEVDFCMLAWLSGTFEIIVLQYFFLVQILYVAHMQKWPKMHVH